MSYTLAPGDRVAVTGAAGFIGSAITRALLARDARVVALLEPGASVANLDGLDVERVSADVTDADELRDVFHDVRFCFHLAAKFGFWLKDPSTFYDVNVRGTQNVIRACVASNVERIVYTSTVATLGLWHTKEGRPSNEDSVVDLSHLYGHYKRSKYLAEHEVLRLAACGAPVELVLPTMPHGPYDHRPTPSGKVVLDYLNGKIPGYVETAMNVAHVDDLAEGHLLALERGTQGRSYICGGKNLTMAELLGILRDTTGLPGADQRFPSVFPMVAGVLSQFIEGELLEREPRVPLEAAQMASTPMIFDDSRARVELGYTSRDPALALYESAKWFVDHGYVDSDRAAMIHWNPPSA